MKTLLFLALIVTLSISSFAQKGMNIEIIANPGMSMGGNYKYQDFYTPDIINLHKTFTFGYNTGVATGYNFNEKSGIRLGVLYSKQGQNSEANWIDPYSLNVTTKRTVSLNYLKIPLQFHYLFSPEKKISFTFSAGLYGGLLLNYKDENKISYSTLDGTTINTYTATDETYTNALATVNGTFTEIDTFTIKPYKTYDFGGTVAVGLQFKLTERISIPIMLNYQIGFMDIKNYHSEYRTSNIYNQNPSFWGENESSNPNALPYLNALLGIKTGLIINL
jgi:hypothetical protein